MALMFCMGITTLQHTTPMGTLYTRVHARTRARIHTHTIMRTHERAYKCALLRSTLPQTCMHAVLRRCLLGRAELPYLWPM